MNTQEWLSGKIAGADSDRTAWQFGCLEGWSKVGYKGTVEASTSSGKTRIALYAIQLLRRNNPLRTVMVVVPTRQLKDQWEKLLKQWKLQERAEVWVINSVIKGVHNCDLLVIDECHRASADTFAATFAVVNYKFVLGLTATMSRLDQKHYIVESYAPVFTRLSIAQARQRGWVASFREYWVGLTLNEDDREEYDRLQEQYIRFFRVFEMDFDTVKRALVDVQLRESIGRRLQMAPGFVHGAASNTLRYLRIMRKWIIEHPSKVDAAHLLITTLDRKTLTFGESIKTAESLSEKIGPKAMAYHSQMSPLEKETFNDKEYKTEAGARRGAVRVSGEYKVKHGKHVVQTRVMKKISGKKLRDYILHKIINTEQLQVVTTAKALSEGFDFPGAQLGVTTSRSSSPTRYVQELGRICRLNDSDTRPVMVHFYLKDTKDSGWLQRAGVGAIGAIRVDSVEECLNHINLMENGE